MPNNMIGLLGFGAAVPATIRYNDDPIFRPLQQKTTAESALFTGLKERRVVTEETELEQLVCAACSQAMTTASISPERIDRVYGYISVSPFLVPNALYTVHQQLHLPETTLIVPNNNEFSNFLTGIIHAWEAILAGHSKYGLVTCGSNWSQHMDYSNGHAFSIGDGAGATVVGKGGKYTLVDYMVETLSAQYGAMTMAYRPPQKDTPAITYHIDEDRGVHSYANDGMEGPPRLVKRVLQKHNIAPADIALTTHQASRRMLQYWHDTIQPGYMFDTLEQYGNMAHATLAVNLAHYHDRLQQPYLLMLALGAGFHQVAVLLRKTI